MMTVLKNGSTRNADLTTISEMEQAASSLV